MKGLILLAMAGVLLGQSVGPIPGGGGGGGSSVSITGTAPIVVTPSPITGTGLLSAPTAVVGPGSATDGHLAVFDGASGKLIKDGGSPVVLPGINRVLYDVGGTIGGSTDLTHDVTTSDFVLNPPSFSPLTIRNTYTGTGSTNQISILNTEVLLTPTANTQSLVGANWGAAMQGNGDFNDLIGNGLSAYSLGNGNGSSVRGYAADAEIDGSAGTTGYLVDFQSYGIYTGSGTTVTNAYHFWAEPGGISGTVGSLYGMRVDSPTITGGTVTTLNVAYFNGNMTGVAGTGKDFSWYSEGGPAHLETGSAAYEGIQIERAPMQSADLLQFLDSDGTTLLAGFNSDARLTNRSVAFAVLGSPSNAQQVYCSDCTVTSAVNDTCAGSGSGAFAERINGVWSCRQ